MDSPSDVSSVCFTQEFLDFHFKELATYLEINFERLKEFLSEIENKYTNTEYHSAHHAVEVFKSFAAFLKFPHSIDRTWVFFAYIAVISHDVGHDGYTNSYHKDNETAIFRENEYPISKINISRF